MLFETDNQALTHPPLADKMRPRTLDDFFGQEDISKKHSFLYKMVTTKSLQSIILWGPPGTGKTSLAHIIGNETRKKILFLSAVSDGVKEIRKAIESSQNDALSSKDSNIVFMDEVHRLNKGQQDVLLPAIEFGKICFIGATTENPSFELNKALLSRCLVISLKLHTMESLLNILKNCQKKYFSDIEIENDVLQNISRSSFGDARRALNLLEAITTGRKTGDKITLKDMTSLELSETIPYDKDADEHYDTVSALIKSIRASHPDAALYYLARLLEGGEDLNFICRRLVISASEDIGNANPHCLNFAQSATWNAQFCGMPEARIILGQLVSLLASSPKSNSAYNGINRAIAEVKQSKNLPIPKPLRNAPTSMMKSMDYGKGYVYPHEDPEKLYKNMKYFPEGVTNNRFYEAKNIGYEKNILATLKENKPHEED